MFRCGVLFFVDKNKGKRIIDYKEDYIYEENNSFNRNDSTAGRVVGFRR